MTDPVNDNTEHTVKQILLQNTQVQNTFYFIFSEVYNVEDSVYLLVCEGVHVSNDLSGHLAGVSGAVLEGSLDDGHDEGQGGGVDEVYKLGVEQRLQARLGPLGRLSESVQQDRGNG